jgi:DNA-binding NarL/FixJ family response regulator
MLISQRVYVAVEDDVETISLGESLLSGLGRPTQVYAVERLRPRVAHATASAAETNGGPLTARELEVAVLIARGCTNRQIAEALVVAEATAVRHVANILNKLNMGSRAQVAVWAVEQGVAATTAGRRAT